MKIVVFGASGKTGLLLVEQALSEGHKVVAYVRSPGSLKLDHSNLEVVVGNLNETDKIRKAITGADACISTLGGKLKKHSPEIKEGIDHIVNLMEETGVQRLIYMSSFGVGDSRYFIPQPVRFLVVDVLFRVPMTDHNINEQRIMKSKLQWTIIRPGSLTDGDKTGNLKHGSEKTKVIGKASISRANVAAFMLGQLTGNQYVNKCVWLYE